MKWVSFYLFSLSAIVHLFFFLLESVFFSSRRVQKMLHVKANEYAAVRIWAFNQGFYNLFLSIGMCVGLSFVLRQNQQSAGVLVGFCGFSMIAAGFVLLISAREAWRGALIQIVPPFLGFVFLGFHIYSSLVSRG